MKIISKEQALKRLRREYVSDEIDIIFAYHKDHPIEDKDGTLRWVEKLDWKDKPEYNPNEISKKYHNGEMTQEEYMSYNRDIGYSLYGYWEVFCFNNIFDEEKYHKEMAIKRDDIINDILDGRN